MVLQIVRVLPTTYNCLIYHDNRLTEQNMERMFPIIVRNTGYLEIVGNMVFFPITLTFNGETVTTTYIECKISTHSNGSQIPRIFNIQPDYEFYFEGIHTGNVRFKILNRIDI